MSDAQLTPSELIFVKRMLPHFMAGMTAEQAAAAVLDDDQRLIKAATENKGQFFMSDFRKNGSFDYAPAATGIQSAMSDCVYRALQAA